MANDEKDFQMQANEYAKHAIESLREMVQALEHADECDGTQECTDCDGTGEIEGRAEGNEDCQTCKGTGSMPCPEGNGTDCADCWHDADAARERIQEDALSVEVRSDWHTPGDSEAQKPSEYMILLATGGPAARIVGDLDGYGQPSSARFEYQDWFKPWTEAHTDSADDAAILTYAQQFYFGE